MVEAHLEKGKSGGRERLLHAARELARKSPFDEITIDEIVKAADLSRPAFYYHFTGGKEELRAVLVRQGDLVDTPTHDTKQAVLEAALRVFARSGVPAATLDDIATEAGVSRSTLNWYFRSKDDLLAAIITNNTLSSPLRTVLEQLEKDIENGAPLDDEKILRCIAGGFYDSFVAQSDTMRLSFLLIHTHPHVSTALTDKIGKGRKRIAQYIHSRQEAGYFRKDVDASLFVQLIAMAFAMIAIGRGWHEVLPFAGLSREEVINQLASLLLHGIVQRGEESPSSTESTSEQ